MIHFLRTCFLSPAFFSSYQAQLWEATHSKSTNHRCIWMWGNFFSQLGLKTYGIVYQYHDVRRRIALGKEAFNKKSDLIRGSLGLHLKKRIVKAFVKFFLFGVLRCMEAKRGLYKKKILGDLRHLKYGYGGEWWKYHGLSTKTNKEILKIVETERKIMDTVRSQQKRWMARSHPETWLITENNVRRTNTGEEGLRKIKNDAFGLATEDSRRQYQLWRTKDVRPGQV